MLLLAQKDACEWLVSLICNDPDSASGACHRSLQILHLLERDHWQLKFLSQPDPIPGRLQTLRYGLVSAARNGILKPLCLHSLRSQGHTSYYVAYLHRRFPNVRGIIIEGTGNGALSSLGEWRRRGVRTVVVPANIESLAPNVGWTHRSPDVGRRFSHERRWWLQADAIHTISFEETWWFQLHGIKAEHFPYYPPPEREKQLLSIRQQRAPDQQLGWLWLADFRNPANRVGVELTLQWLQSCPAPPRCVVVAGRGCSWLHDYYGSRLPFYARVLGEVSNHQLHHLYCNCTAQLIVHPATSGMLTRVVDAAIAGIPVVGNSMAVKSYAYCFQSATAVTYPVPPETASARFLAELNL